MPDFTEAQEKEIQKRIEQARNEEQYTIAGIQAYRAALLHLAGLIDKYDAEGNLVQQGYFDPFVYQVLELEFINFQRNRGIGKQEVIKVDDGEK